MMGFLEWVEFNRKKKEKEEKSVRTNNQSGQENRSSNLQGQVDRYDQEIPSTILHYFAEPK
jgi:hypothetical protein